MYANDSNAAFWLLLLKEVPLLLSLLPLALLIKVVVVISVVAVVVVVEVSFNAGVLQLLLQSSLSY